MLTHLLSVFRYAPLSDVPLPAQGSWHLLFLLLWLLFSQILTWFHPSYCSGLNWMSPSLRHPFQLHSPVMFYHITLVCLPQRTSLYVKLSYCCILFMCFWSAPIRLSRGEWLVHKHNQPPNVNTSTKLFIILLYKRCLFGQIGQICSCILFVMRERMQVRGVEGGHWIIPKNIISITYMQTNSYY